MAAYRLGDPTAKDAGRLTLNPLAHLDLVGTIALFIVHIGWAKPVPVNPYYFQNPRRDMVKVAIAGPGSNIILALISGIILHNLIGSVITPYSVFHKMMSFMVFINVALAIFNMIPIPPLDGSKVVAGMIPIQHLDKWEAFERKGGFILIGLILLGMLTGISVFAPVFYMSYFLSELFSGRAPIYFSG